MYFTIPTMKSGRLNESSNNFLFHIFIRKNTDDAPSWLATAGKKKDDWIFNQ